MAQPDGELKRYNHRLQLSPKTDRDVSQGSSEQRLKLLYDGLDAQIDVVAVHGLNGHREKSWTTPNGTNWLRSLLPVDIPSSRIYTWGYTVPTEKTNLSKLWQEVVSEDLLSALWQARESTNSQSRPIIFVTHSLGGVIVKNALNYSESVRDGPLRYLHSISRSTYGVFFMGTLEPGTRMDGLRSFLATNQENGQRATDSHKEAKWMLDVLDEFSKISDRFEIVIVSESLDPTKAQDAHMYGSNSNSGKHIVISADHDGLVKFESASDDGYQKLKTSFLCMMASVRNRPKGDLM